MSGNFTDVPIWLKPGTGPFLTDAETSILNKLFDCILPADHARQLPGAVEVGASNFVSTLLGMSPDVYWEIPNWCLLYRDGLRELDAYARTNFTTAFIDLDVNAVSKIIGDLENGKLPGWSAALDQKLLFKTLLRHCIQGCFSDPRWGGNKDRIMWRAMGYLQPPEELFQ